MKSAQGQVISLNVSDAKGTTKHPVSRISVDQNGIVGDAHAGRTHRQVSFLSREIVEEFEKEIGRSIKPGEFAENMTILGIDLRKIAVLDRIVINDVELEVTQIGKECHDGHECAIFKEVGKCVMPREGIFTRVIRGGEIRTGDAVQFMPRPLRIRIVTISDRASKGEYADRSGPEIAAALTEFFAGRRWHPEVTTGLVPDEADLIRADLVSAGKNGFHVVITTGGTGIGPRDVTPDVVASLADKTIPGVMEEIRAKFGAKNPNALLSRSVACVMGQSLVYALPGSVRAAREYMGEILKTLEHALFMLHGLDAHHSGGKKQKSAG